MDPYAKHIYKEDGTVKCDKISLMYVNGSERCCDGCDEITKVGVLYIWGNTTSICKKCLLDISKEIK